MKTIILVAGLMVILLIGSVNAQDVLAKDQKRVCTSTSETVTNKDGTITKTLYGGKAYGYDGAGCVKIEDMESLKGEFDVVYKEFDGIHDFEVVDFNLTSITLKPYVRTTIGLNEYIPLKIDDVTISNIIYSRITDRMTFLIQGDDILNKNFTFGSASTTIILQDPDTEILDDTYVRESSPTTPGGSAYSLYVGTYPSTSAPSWALYKFNISSFSGVNVINASFCAYLGYEMYEGDEDIYITVSGSSVIDWDESSLTWNTRPLPETHTIFYNEYFENYNPPTEYNCFNSTEYLDSIDTQDNVTFIINHSTTSFSDYVFYRAKEYYNSNQHPYLNITYEEGAPGDDPPTTTLTTTDGYGFTSENISLQCSATDDYNVTGINLWTNISGTWEINQTLNGSETTLNANFTLNGTPDGVYKWNCEAWDNNSQSDWGNSNRTFSVSTECVDADCYPYMCNTETNLCYTSCTSHSHCNSTTYCADDNTCDAQVADNKSCQYLELDGLTDNDVCTGGYCYDDTVQTTGEYCTDDIDNCVDAEGGDAVIYTSGQINCFAGNDYQTCNDNGVWSSVTDCKDYGDGYNPIATYGTHTYCGYWNPQTCGATGCINATPSTTDCGNFYFQGPGCGTGTSSCDIGCGAPYDLSTCAPPNTLSADCITCTPPEIDDPPSVILISPDDDYTSSSSSVTIEWSVADEYPLMKCELWIETINLTWHMNTTNTSATVRTPSTNTITQNYEDGDAITWNVLCYDNESQTAWADQNYTFDISLSYVEELTFSIVNGSVDGRQLFNITQSGNAEIAGNLYIWDTLYTKGGVKSFSPVYIDELDVSEYLDINHESYTKVRITNPADDYIKFEGEDAVGTLIIGLFNINPLFTTTSLLSKFIFDRDIEIRGDLNVTGTTHTDALDIENLTTERIAVSTDFPEDPGIYVGGAFSNSEITYAAIYSAPTISVITSMTDINAFSSNIQPVGTEDINRLIGMSGLTVTNGGQYSGTLNKSMGAMVQSINILGSDVKQAIGLYGGAVNGGDQNWFILDESGQDSNFSASLIVEENITVQDSINFENSTTVSMGWNGTCYRIDVHGSGNYFAIC